MFIENDKAELKAQIELSRDVVLRQGREINFLREEVEYWKSRCMAKETKLERKGKR